MLEDPETSRKLILATNRADLRVVLVRASDVPTYVQYGGADLGVVGHDMLLEHGGEGLYQPLDLRHRALPHERGRARRLRLRRRGEAGLAHPRGHQVHAASRASTSPTRACTST